MPIRHPLWFRLLRFPCRGAAERAEHNRALEAPDMGFILGQQTCPDFRVGTQRMARVGCEIAAAYNALRLCGRTMRCTEIIRIFEERGFLMGALTVGDLGADPYAIGEFLGEMDIPYVRCDFEAMRRAADGSRGQAGVFIVSFWNRRGIGGGLHTAAFFTCEDDRQLHVLNFHGTDTGIRAAEQFSDLTDGGRFITGYRLTASSQQTI